jgi:HAE1 family hydrophobic/amphiphilic exporter-1
VPLLTATGAGAEGRKVMGMTVFAGMLVATILGVCLIPMLFVVVEKLTGRSKHPAPATPAVPPQPLAAQHGHGSH